MLDDGRPLAESNAILWYFAEDTQYLPSDGYERAQVLHWMLFEQHSSMPNIAVMRFWLRWAQEKPGEAEMEPKRRAGYAALDAMEDHLASREFFVGDRYSIADIALYGYTHVAEEGSFSLDGYPAIGAWLERVRSSRDTSRSPRDPSRLTPPVTRASPNGNGEQTALERVRGERDARRCRGSARRAREDSNL